MPKCLLKSFSKIKQVSGIHTKIRKKREKVEPDRCRHSWGLLNVTI